MRVTQALELEMGDMGMGKGMQFYDSSTPY
jgi:hypothetical protein